MHLCICNSGLETHRSLGNHIVPMFVECGSVIYAQQAFNKLLNRNEHSWTSLIVGYIASGQLHDALNLYPKMQGDGKHPSAYTFIALLKACVTAKDICQIHDGILKDGFGQDIFVANTLLHMHAKCGSLKEAREVFDKLLARDIVSWNAMIAGYVENGLCSEALVCLEQMRLENVNPNATTCICSLKACSYTAAIDKGRKLHKELVQLGYEGDPFVGNALVDMYFKCGFLLEAQETFRKLPYQDLVSWNTLLTGYVEEGHDLHALKSFEQMQTKGIYPDAITLTCVLKACGNVGALVKGREIHAEASLKGFEEDIFVGSTLTDMYARCSSLLEAQRIFDILPERSTTSWTILIAGFLENGLNQEALKCYKQMQLEGLSPDPIILRCLIGLFARTGLVATAKEVFHKLPTRDVESWTLLIGSYAENGLADEALKCLDCMLQEGMSPDAITFVCCLKACGSMGAMDKGRELHTTLSEKGVEVNLFVGSALIDMYSKCGSFVEAKRVFDELQVRDTVAWTTMIKACGMNHDGDMAMRCFVDMQEEGAKPDAVTFLCLLSVCTHTGMVSKGQECFKMMKEQFGITPATDHYICMIDLFARSGYLYNAEKLIKAAACPPIEEAWLALLNACKIYKETELGFKCFQQILEINPEGATSYVLMGNVYANAGNWDDANRFEEMRKHSGAKNRSRQ